MKTIISNLAVVFLFFTSYSQTISWIPIDSMNNASNIVRRYHNPIAYDPYSKVVAIVHPGKGNPANTFGNIYYNYSPDNGQTWSNHIGTGGGIGPPIGQGQFPTITLANGRHYSKKESVLVDVVFSYPRESANDGLVYEVDPGVGAGSFIAFLDSSNWGSHFAFWASDNSDDTWLAGFGGGTKGISGIHSPDGISYTKFSPKQWADSTFRELDGIVRGVCRNGTIWIAVRGKFINAVDTSLMTLGVSKSTDKGVTWSNLDVVNFHTISGLSHLMTLPSNDFTVDGSGTCHWLAALVDTTYVPNKWVLMDIYKPSGGSWSATKIRDLPTHENWRYGSLNDSYIENELSVSKDGKLVAAKWLEDQRGVAYKDSVPLADVYVSFCNTVTGEWTTPESATSTPAEDEQLTHIAPIFDDDQTIYLSRYMQTGRKSYPDENALTVLYFRKWTNHKIDESYLTLISPVGGEVWETGSVQKISWDYYSVFSGVKIDFSSDSGATWQYIDSVDQSASPYNWTVPNAPSGICKIRIGGYLQWGYYATASNTFTIKEKPSGVHSENDGIPHQFFLAQNYPNPFNPSTTILYAVPTASKVKLTIFNVLGETVDDLINEKQSAGWKEVHWNANVASGLYFYRLESVVVSDPNNRFVQVKKMLLLK